MKSPTKVIFRRDRTHPRDVFAFMPCEPSDVQGYYCTCYQHVGQHSSGDPLAMVAQSRPATRAEYHPLARELRRIGYRLQIVRRVPRNALEIRRKALPQ